MSNIEKNNNSLERIDNTKRIIAILERIPEEKRDLVAMLGIAFLSGIESSGIIEQVQYNN